MEKAQAIACQESPSPDTRSNYDRDIRQFLEYAGIDGNKPDKLARFNRPRSRPGETNSRASA